MNGDRKIIRHIRLHYINQSQFGQLGKNNARRQAQAHRNYINKQSFPDKNTPYIALAHAQHVIKPKFLFAAAYYKGIGIKEKYAGKHRYYPSA